MREWDDTRLKWCLSFVALVGIVVWISLNVRALGFRIGQPELELDYTMGVLWWIVFALGILIFSGDSRRMLLLAWIGKFFVVLVLMLFYERHYGLDAYSYFKVTLTGEFFLYPGHDFRTDLVPSILQMRGESGKLSAGGLGTENTLRFMLMIGSVTGPFYHAMKVAVAFLGLLGVWWYYRAVVIALGRPYPAAFYLLAFFPSIIFWSSILGKDPFMFFFLGIYAYGGALWLIRGRPAALWWVGLGLFGTYLVRPWMALMAGAVLLLATLLGRSRGWQVGFVLVVAIPVFGYVAQLGLSQIYTKELQTIFILESVATITRGYAYKEVSGGGQDIDFSSAQGVTDNIPLTMLFGGSSHNNLPP